MIEHATKRLKVLATYAGFDFFDDGTVAVFPLQERGRDIATFTVVGDVCHVTSWKLSPDGTLIDRRVDLLSSFSALARIAVITRRFEKVALKFNDAPCVGPVWQDVVRCPFEARATDLNAQSDTMVVRSGG